MSSATRVPFLAIGHTARDEFPDGRWRLGGSALYGAATAAKLGADVTLVTRVGPGERESLETLCQEALQKNLSPQPRSGLQEQCESIIADAM